MGVEVRRHLNLVIDVAYFFLNFLLNPARPIRPEPRRSMVVGSGTGGAVSINGVGCPDRTKLPTLTTARKKLWNYWKLTKKSRIDLVG